MPPSDRTATSVVPPPISTTMEPVGSVTGRPAPIAAAIGSSISHTLPAAAPSGGSRVGGVLGGGGGGGHADHDLRMGEAAAVVNLRDEVLDHRLGDFEVGDDAVAQGADRLNVAGRAAQHHLGFLADREHLALAALRREGNDRRLIQDDAAT